MFKMWFKRSHISSVVFGFVLVFVNVPVTWTQTDIKVPKSPCPELFSYRYNGTRYYGYGELKNPPIDQDVVLKVNFIIDAELPEVYSGKTQPVDNDNQIVNAIYWNKIVKFEIKLPSQNPLPLISSITMNDDVICENSKIPLPSEETTEVSTTTTRSAQVNNIGCGKIQNIITPLIFGGTTIKRGEWPWLAAIYHNTRSSYTFRCAGTIISNSAVLSAAHCFYERKRKIRAEDIAIFLGYHNLKWQEVGSKIVNVDSITIHPDYMSKTALYSDIAIVKLIDPVEFSELIQPACLWSEGIELDDVVGQIGVVVGWGRDEYGNLNTPEPKKVRMPIVSELDCLRSNVVFHNTTNDRTFCGGWRNGTEGPCQGDSGTGMFLNKNESWFIRGLVSSSVTNQVTLTCDLFEYVVFTDVAKFSSWIENNLT